MSRRARSLARLSSVALVLAATLPPVGGEVSDSLSFGCVLCGPAGAAELVMNAALFVPLGLTVARPERTGPGAAAALACGLALSGCVEAAQVFLPGRYPALGDLLANAAGAGLGGLLAVRAPAWLRPSPEAAGRWSAAWGALVAGVALATGALLVPSLPTSAWWVQRAPDLGHLECFRGAVLTARSGELRLPEGRMSPGARRALASRLIGGPRLSARVLIGPPPRGIAPVVRVMDDRQREIFLLGRDGPDLVLRVRRRADALRLETPAHRAAGILSGRSAGDTLALTVRPGGATGPRRSDGWAGFCLGAGSLRRCGLGFRVGRGWSLLADLDVPPAAARGLDGAWITLLFVPLGLWARPRTGWWAGMAAAAGGLLAAPAAGPLLGVGASEVAGVVVGVAAGALAAGWGRATGDQSDSPASSSP